MSLQMNAYAGLQSKPPINTASTMSKILCRAISRIAPCLGMIVLLTTALPLASAHAGQPPQTLVGFHALAPTGMILPGMDDGEEALGLIIRLLVAGLGVVLASWVFARPRHTNRITRPGFEVISPSERRNYIPLEEKHQAMDFINGIKTQGKLRLSANLNKVTLSIRKYGYLMEDKNYRNALLVNRRRVRRTLLRNGDVLDLGDLTLLYRDNRLMRITRYAPVTPPEGKVLLKFEKAKGPVRKGTPMLVPEQFPNRVFYITKNKVFIGRSEANDLVIKSSGVQNRHAKIEQVGGKLKIQDLTLLGSTYINNRRIEQRFLREGDEIGIENHKFKYQLAPKPIRERMPRAQQAAPPSADSESVEQEDGLDNGMDSVADNATDTDLNEE